MSCHTFTIGGSTIRAQDIDQILMALPMILALTICPALLGTQEAVRQSQAKNKREEHRSRRCNLVVSCVKPSVRRRDIDGRLIVLRDNKLFIENDSDALDSQPASSPSAKAGHPFTGYFLPYPDSQYEGLVSTISDDPPMLNWIYIDRNTYEVKYGVRADAQPHLTGPFDCTRQDRRMTLDGWEGFVAVEEYPGSWALYFDRDDDGLVTKVPMGTRVLEVELARREKKEAKAPADPPSGHGSEPKPQPQPESGTEHEISAQDEAHDLDKGDQAQNGQANHEKGPWPPLLDQELTPLAHSSSTDNPMEREMEKRINSSEPSSPGSSHETSDEENTSVWSAADKSTHEADSATIATSFSESDESAPESQTNTRDRRRYKAPYVEDE
ncbi:hypothetical protein CDD82_6178 [Ophiocordyceps australis]|uniref:Uncharacterized protein n=1 Tax=Ophiocordyceps australis TaxID=1399860 RepID=A0A2C5YWG5_9HYPO|nr:hypothetical protein CDD82_6178 [Ophiocordyceps australis]